MAKDKYRCFKDLAANEVLGKDYQIECRRTHGSCVAVIAPHGGKIEPRTDEIAEAIAGSEFSLYCFKGLNKGLHIASHAFDEETCVDLIADHTHVLSIHGWGEKGKRICVGGRDTELIIALKKGLADNGGPASH